MKNIFKNKKILIGIVLFVVLIVVFSLPGNKIERSANSGKEIEWYGVVLQQTDEGYRVNSSSYLKDSSYDNVIVKTKDTNLQENDYIKYKGKYAGITEYKSTMGLNISAHVVQAELVEKSSYIEAISPTTKEITVNETKDQHNYLITLEKIEFADKETRIYFKVENKGKANFNLYSFNMKISQNGKQFEEDSNWDANYPEIQTDLMPGNNTIGIVSFPKIEQSDFKLVLDASSDDWNEEFNKFEFEISIN